MILFFKKKEEEEEKWLDVFIAVGSFFFSIK